MTRADRDIHAVRTLLDQQRSALLQGDFDALETMPERLARALRRLAANGAPRDQIESLQARAAHNARLIGAARRGVAQAMAHLKQTSRTGLTTYAADGRQVAATSAGSLLSRR